MRRVHNDYTEWSGPQRVRDLMGDEAEELLRKRFAIVQRGGRSAIRSRAPLAMAMSRSMLLDDLVVTERRYPGRIGQT